jgi:RNA polymerase sigma-70 factor (ECF subfamily)
VEGKMQISDDELVEKYRNGDTEAFNCLVERYGKPLYNFIFRMLGDRAEAEDILQGVFLRVIRNIHRYKMKGRFKSWIFTIANKLTISELRKKSRRKTFSLEEYAERKGIAEPGDVLADIKNLPDSAVERRELQEKMNEVINSLPFEQRQVLMMRHFAGLSFREIAGAVGCPLNTALGRMYYALRNMRKNLREFYE